MAFSRRWFLILAFLLLGGGSVLAASREDRTYRAAVQAFQDQFYALAESQLTQYLQSYHKSTNAPMALLLLAQSEYYLKDYPTAINRLSDPANRALAKAAGLDDSYLYWRAEAQSAMGDLASAAQSFVSVANEYPGSPLALNAVVEAAAAYETLGQRHQVDELLTKPNGLFQRMAQTDSAHEQVANGRLLLAESQWVRRNAAAVIQLLDLINPARLTLDQNWKRTHLLYQARLSQNNFDAALAAVTNLVQIARGGQGEVWSARLADGVADYARLLESQNQLAAASDVWQMNLAALTPAAAQQEAILKLADLAARQGRNQEAEKQLSGFLSQFPDAPASAVIPLACGELKLQDYVLHGDPNNLAEAQEKLRQFLTLNTNGLLAGKAFLDQGWCRWLMATNDPVAAARYLLKSQDDFQSAVAQLQVLPPSYDLAVARFKLGDVQFALTNFPGAETNYLAVAAYSSQFSEFTNSLGSRAWYQLLRAYLAETNAAGIETAMRQLVSKYFNSTEGDRARLLAGEGLSDFDSPAKARALFLQFASERTNSELLPEVLFAAARTYEREANWLAAVTNYQNWLNIYTNEWRPKVEYERAWALAQMGDENGAFQLFTNYVAIYPAAELTPRARWWLAGHYFQLGTNLPSAEYNYQWISTEFPSNTLACPAQLMAARVAMARGSYTDAIRYLKQLVNNTNCQDLEVPALFAYCEVLRRNVQDTNLVNNLQMATNSLSQICAQYPTNEAGALAWDEIGDCDLQLGAYDAATNAYAQAVAVASVLAEAAPAQGLEDLVCRIKVSWGEALEKKAEVDGSSDADRKALLGQALNQYLEVVYTRARSNAYWVKEAAWKALLLIGGNHPGDPAELDRINVLISRLETWFPQMRETLEKKRPH